MSGPPPTVPRIRSQLTPDSIHGRHQIAPLPVPKIVLSERSRHHWQHTNAGSQICLDAPTGVARALTLKQILHRAPRLKGRFETTFSLRKGARYCEFDPLRDALRVKGYRHYARVDLSVVS